MSKNTIYSETYKQLGPARPGRIIYEGTVTEAGTDPNNPFRIKVRTDLDRDSKTPYGEEPYCDPFMPIFYNIIPNVGDVVRIILPYGASNDELKRLWVGPLSSHPIYYNGESNISYFNLNLPDTKRSTKVPVVRGKNINKAEGVYANYFLNETQNVNNIDFSQSSLNGKNNTDLLFRSQRVTLRAGKFKIGKPLEINDVNPAYIDLFLDSDGSKSHVNIVADKINLVALEGRINPPAVINSERQQQVIEGDFQNPNSEEPFQEGLQPLVYGNKLVEFLEILRTFVRSHKHDYHAQPSRKNDDNEDGNTNAVLDFDLNSLLSKNVKTN